MKELAENLYVGTTAEYRRWDGPVVSTCKSVWEEKDSRSPKKLVLEFPNHLIVNWVDGAAKYFEWTGPEAFTKINDFIDFFRPVGPVLVHCDMGLSRSPTACMVYLSKRGSLSKDFYEAKAEFRQLYPQWSPGGILDYIQDNWEEIR